MIIFSSGTKVCWTLILCLVSLSIGFLGGVVVGAIVQRDGHLSQVCGAIVQRDGHLSQVSGAIVQRDGH